jgi:hypothetical protein
LLRVTADVSDDHAQLLDALFNCQVTEGNAAKIDGAIDYGEGCVAAEAISK